MLQSQRARRSSQYAAGRWSCSVLEQRVMLAGDLGVADFVVGETEAPAEFATAAANANQTLGSDRIVFIDGDIGDLQTFVDALPRDADWVLIDPANNALQQITDAIRGRSNLRSLHIVSHGEAGQLRLGDAIVDIDALNSQRAMLASWAKSLSDDADILLYGCNTASGAAGGRFITLLSELTGADVAGSVDRTGNVRDGGDWVLERAAGSIDTGVILTGSARDRISGTLNIVIDAWGQTGDEEFNLLIDGQVVQSYDAATTWTPFLYETDEPLTADRVRVEFTNDVYDPNGYDRNLFVPSVNINGKYIKTDDPSVYSTGTWRSEDGVTAGYGRGDVLHANGYFQFGTAPSDNGSTVVVNASGEMGGEQFVLIAGDQTFDPQTISSDQQAYTFETDRRVTAGSIRIEFINDLYQPEQGIDRNLTVDNIVIDGVTYETESPDVYAFGVFVPGQGITQGFLETETLQANGYFQYNGPRSDAEAFVPDTSFADNGFAVVGGGFPPAGIAASSEGKTAIITRDLRQADDGSTFTVAELHVYLADGERDTSFGDNGTVELTELLKPFLSQPLDPVAGVFMHDIDFDSQGRIVVLGTAFFREGNVRSDQSAILRVTADGSLDTSFAANGLIDFAPFFPLEGQQVSIDDNDRVVVGGSVGQSIGAVRLDQYGVKDPSFANQGELLIAADQVPGFSREVHELEHIPGGSIVMLAGDPQANVDIAAAIFRFDVNGNPDTSFGVDGRATVPRADFDPSAGFSESYRDATIDSGGRIVVAGQRSMLRYTASGQLDVSFADDGLLVIPEQIIDGGRQLLPDLGSLVVDSQDRVIAATFLDQFVLRVDTDGTLSSLSDDGYQRLDLLGQDSQSNPKIADILIDASDRLIVGGQTTQTTFLGWYIIA